MGRKHSLDPFPASVRVTVTGRMPDDRVGETSADDGEVWIKIKTGPEEQELGAAVHEAVHAVQFVEEWIGGRLDDETQAYLTQRIAQMAFAELKKKRGER